MSCFQPQVWCTHLCPLGYCFDLLHVKSGRRVFQRDRRQFLAGIGIGLPGAIRRLSDDAKWRRQIGVARVEKDKCLAWADRQYCMVCDEYCPYNAIDTHWEGDIACPVVNTDLCRGCGACENACPALRAGKAIFVHALDPQKSVRV